MAISCYTGKQGSGKTYQVVKHVIVPAIRDGRRVVTNIDGINEEEIRKYCIRKYKRAIEDLGSVLKVKDDAIKTKTFFPDDVAEGHSPRWQSTVQNGDIVVIDEAWRFWATRQKYPEEHEVYFRMHRHMVDAKTGLSSEIVIMTQRIKDLKATLKEVVMFSFNTKKLTALGVLGKSSYVVEMWNGYDQSRKSDTSKVHRYDKQIFPLYKSYAGPGVGVEKSVDARQGAVGTRLMVGGALLTAGAIWGVWDTIRYFDPPELREHIRQVDAAAGKKAGVVASTPGAKASAEQPVKERVTQVSKEWRVVGRMDIRGERYVALIGQSGRIRYETPSSCSLLLGRPHVCNVDGARVVPFGSAGTPAAATP